jgi:hypothetical protein
MHRYELTDAQWGQLAAFFPDCGHDGGPGVRELHRKAQTVIKEHFVLEPVLAKTEGETVDVPANFDPSAIRLTGNVTGQPPFRGVLRVPLTGMSCGFTLPLLKRSDVETPRF